MKYLETPMNVQIDIHYLSHAGRVLQRGSFQSRGKKPEEVALQFLRVIKNETEVLEVEKIILNGTEDIKEKVLELEKTPLD